MAALFVCQKRRFDNLFLGLVAEAVAASVSSLTVAAETTGPEFVRKLREITGPELVIELQEYDPVGGNVMVGFEDSGGSIWGNPTVGPWIRFGEMNVEEEVSRSEDFSWSQIHSWIPGLVKSILEMNFIMRGISQGCHSIGMIFRHLSSKIIISVEMASSLMVIKFKR